MKKKLSALFMVFAMVLSLFSGLGVNTVWASVHTKRYPPFGTIVL